MPNPFFETPRIRRLRRDLADMKRLAEESSVVSFEASGDAPSEYLVTFSGKGLGEDHKIHDVHKVRISMGAGYPANLPVIKFQTDLKHPNVSGGVPCFGTFLMNPNVRLVDIVEMLWDMVRMSTYNPYSGYGDRDIWSTLRKKLGFPLDPRILRDKVEGEGDDPEEPGEPDLIIMSGASLCGMPPSQVWVKAALGQYFESRGIGEHVNVITGDDFFRDTGNEVPGLVSALMVSREFQDAMTGESSESNWLRDDIKAFLNRLGLRIVRTPSPDILLLVSREG